MKQAKPRISHEEMSKIRDRIGKLSNSTKFDEARELCQQMAKTYSNNTEFLYMEAVFSAEDDVGFTPTQIAKRHANAAAKIKSLFPRIRSLEPRIRGKMRNEYYWFSHQPQKQYELGVEMVNKGFERFYYSQGVGAVEVAKLFAEQNKRAAALRWAKKSEVAWKKFLKMHPEWFNAYFFYAQALGYQQRFTEMDQALAYAAKNAGKPKSWIACKEMRKQILAVASLLA